MSSPATVLQGGELQYLAVRDHLAAWIERDAGRTGKLPPERRLQATLGAARGTIREALFQLEAEGLIYRRDRNGWFVSPAPVIYDPTQWTGFMAYVAAQGRTPETSTLETTIIAAGARLAEIFGVAPDAPIQLIRRLRRIDGRAVLVERIAVDPTLAPGLLGFSLDGSLTSILRARYGVEVVRNKVEMVPCALIKHEAQALGVKSGTSGEDHTADEVTYIFADVFVGAVIPDVPRGHDGPGQADPIACCAFHISISFLRTGVVIQPG